MVRTLAGAPAAPERRAGGDAAVEQRQLGDARVGARVDHVDAPRLAVGWGAGHAEVATDRHERTGRAGVQPLACVTLVPRFWLLTQSLHSRIFTEASVPTIVSTVLAENTLRVPMALSSGFR